MKCPSCGNGFNGASSESSFSQTSSPTPVQSSQQGVIPTYSSGYSQIGGWLLLPSIGLVVSFFTILVGGYDLLKPYFQRPDILGVLTDPLSKYYIPYFLPVFSFEVILNVCLVFMISKAILLLFQRSSRAPKLIIFFYMVHFFGLLTDLILSNLITSQLHDKDFESGVIRAFWTMVIWGLYFYRSDRVKRTFTEP
ncbi:DUF2569 domain-containing protein [Polynucleobacter paneuropaeus]|nr:DUF2569 domain-containing protein [Polynucleobacter paneuropaeus]